jgi:hypothetical protein
MKRIAVSLFAVTLFGLAGLAAYVHAEGNLPFSKNLFFTTAASQAKAASTAQSCPCPDCPDCPICCTDCADCCPDCPDCCADCPLCPAQEIVSSKSSDSGCCSQGQCPLARKQISE